MFEKIRSKNTAVFLIFSFLLFFSPSLILSQDVQQGQVAGNVFDKDGTTPLAGAVVIIRDVASGNLYQSSPTDANGSFKIENVAKGVYVFGVKTDTGEFNSDNMFGVEAGKTSKLSISLELFDAKNLAAAHDLYKDQIEKGESLVGKIIGYSRSIKMTEVYMLRGFMQTDDRLHIQGEKTDFNQNLRVMKLEGNDIIRAYAGQTVMMKVEYDVVTGDLVYVKCKKSSVPFFLIPIGIAAIVAGAIVTPCPDCPPDTTPVSAFRK